MPAAIAVTSAELVLPATDPHTPAAVALQPPDRQQLEEALAETGALLDQHGYLIVLCHTGLPAAVTQRLHTLRSILESDRIALLTTGLPPLATAVLTRQLRQLSICDFSPGVIASAARLLAHYIHAGAQLGSVSRLDRVPVSLAAHAKSWVPGAQFVVLANPQPTLLRLGGTAQETPSGPQFATRLTYARGQLNSDWVPQTLGPAWQVGAAEEVELPTASARWWATAKLVEFAAAIPDISVLYQLVASVRREQCRWCGLELIGDRCGFCAAPVAPPEHPPRQARALTPGGRDGRV
ncbi:hypothetical protein [Streptomyces sp. NPDC006879]|uniref:hypothetical protein n=1 Tax=Streptomyces sp. NPDC006879 TaxID=3364767 RepID=UPI0036A75A7D